jgi:lipopolysaccharide/colanic/teichoic acid biosynthesis glycosyltransferase
MLKLRKPFQRRLRLQLPFLLILNYIVSSLVLAIATTNASIDWTNVLTGAEGASLLFGVAASATGLLICKQLQIHPGVSRTGHMLVCLAVCIFFLMLLILMFRFPYSRTVLFSCFVVATIFPFLEALLAPESGKPVFGIISVGDAALIKNSVDANWLQIDITNPIEAEIDAIFTDLHVPHDEMQERFLISNVMQGIPVYDFRDIQEELTGRVTVQHLHDSALGIHLPGSLGMQLKRIADIGLAILLLIPFSVVIAIFAVLIKLESAGPAVFTHPRMGYRGKTFTIYKLRSMTASDHSLAAKSYTEINDSRITTIGRFIRKFRIDELPQIFNILRGDMSWIGPRPEAVDLAEEYERQIPFYIYRHTVRPGITGWAQVMQGNVNQVENIKIKLQYDFYYIKHFSVWLDLIVTLKTVWIIVTGFGSR